MNIQSLERRTLLSALDLTFGIGGEAIVPFNFEAQDVIVQSDGKVLLAGDDNNDALLVRLNLDGSVDDSFGDHGIARLDVGGAEYFEKVRLQLDGKILAAGASGENELLIARFRADGHLDTNSGFGGNAGYIRAAGDIYEMALSGTAIFTVSGDILTKRSLSTGAIDSSFASNGTRAISDITSLENFQGYSVALRPDGRIMIVGRADLPPESDPDYFAGYYDADLFLVALTTSGAADNSFASNGVTYLYELDANGGPYDGDVAVTSDGTIYTAHAQEYHAGEVILTKWSSSGDILWQQVNLGFGLFENGTPDLDLTPDGKVLISRSSEFARYKPNSSFDSSLSKHDGTDSLIAPMPFGGQVLHAVGPSGEIVAVPMFAQAAVYRLTPTTGGVDGNVWVSSSGTILIHGTPQSDVVTIRRDGDLLEVLFNDEYRSFYRTGIRRINVVLYGGGDILKASGVNRRISVDGGEGDDVILGGEFADTIIGANGNDYIDGGPGADDLHGNAGEDTVSYASRKNGVHVTPDNLADDGERGEGDNVHDDFETIFGGKGNDRLYGTNDSNVVNVLEGREGDDTLFGLDGVDILYGGTYGMKNPGKNWLYGGGGSDRLRSLNGFDHLVGGKGPDNFEYDDARNVVLVDFEDGDS